MRLRARTSLLLSVALLVQPVLMPASATGPEPELALPAARQGPTATWVPTQTADCPEGCAYIFGGWRNLVFLNDIARFDPASGTFAAMAGKLPRGNFEPRAFWDGRDRPEAGCGGGCVYLLGGRDGLTALDTILVYHPATDTLRTSTVRLPFPVWSTTVVWTGTEAFLFGGCVSHDTNCVSSTSRLVRFDPVEGVAQQLDATFPAGRYLVAGTWDRRDLPLLGCAGGCAYLYGGWDAFEDPAATREVFRYNPATDHLLQLPVLLSEGRGGGVGVWHNGAAWVLGGCTSSDGAQCGNEDAETAAVDRHVPEAIALTTEPREPLAVETFHSGPAYDGERVWLFGGCCPAADLAFAYVFPPPPVEEQLFEASAPLPPLPPLPAPPTVGEVVLRDEGPFLCADLALLSAPPQNLACVERAALGPAADGVPRGGIPIAPPVGLPDLAVDSAIVRLSFLHDPAQEGDVVTLLGHTVAVPRPFEPSPGGALWFATHGPDTALRLSVVLEDEGQQVAGAEVAVPWAGQLLGSAVPLPA